MRLEFPCAVRQTAALADLSFVLLDADDYLRNGTYAESRRAGEPALRNLWAFDRAPLVARSFSGYSCEISCRDGVIVQKAFHK